MRKRFFLVVLVLILFTSVFIFENKVSSASNTELHPGEPHSVQMLQRPLDEIHASIMASMLDREMPGAVVLIAKDSTIVKHETYGHAVRYIDADFTETDNPVYMENDTIFDLASISKLFAVTAAMHLYEQGKFELDDPVVEHIPEFAKNDKSEVTIRQLMTHTSGFTAWLPLESMADSREEALEIVLTNPLKNEPGSNYEYSDLNMITLGALVEEWSGEGLDEYVRKNITEPLGMVDTMYNPPESLKDRIAATAYVPGRGMVRGTVHDGNALVLDGVAGHAGVFSTANDLAIFSQMMLNKGSYQDVRILKSGTVDLVLHNHTPEFPGNDHGLGWELNQPWYMAALAEASTMGHTGFTGTSIVVSPTKQSISILLTNRVHPIDQTPSTNPIRKIVAQKTADAINAWSASNILAQIELLEENGQLTDIDAAHALKIHLTAVSQYEKKEQDEKIIKHLEGFKLLLNNQMEGELISGEVYKTLNKNADYLIEKWFYQNQVPPYEKQPVIGVLPLEIEVAPEEETELSIHGLDVNGHKLNIDQNEVLWQVEGDVGTVEDGVFTANKQGNGTVIATYDGVSAKRNIIVADNLINNIRYGLHPNYTRVVIDLNKSTQYDIDQMDGKLILSVPYAKTDGDLGESGMIEIPNSPVISKVNYQFEGDIFTAEIQLKKEMVIYETPNFTDRIVIDVIH